MYQVDGGGDCSCQQVISCTKLMVKGLLLSAGYIMYQVDGGGDCSCQQVISCTKLMVEGTAPVGRLYHVPS